MPATGRERGGGGVTTRRWPSLIDQLELAKVLYGPSANSAVSGQGSKRLRARAGPASMPVNR